MSSPHTFQSAITFTIVVPAYNEAADIGGTCEALVKLDPPPDEIVFIDDASTDETPNIIRQHLIQPSMHLVVQKVNRGPAAARNVGVRAATGDVVVFVDADVRLPRDFLRRLAPHYERGADSVAVEATEAPEVDNVYGRYLHAHHQYLYGGDAPIAWSQAFSCRRATALDAGLFPDTLPGPGGEDGEFVRRVATCTSRRVVDRTIVVRHAAPATLRDFWRQWLGRGVAIPFLRRRVHHVPWPRLVAERAAAGLWSLLLIATVVPIVRRSVHLASLSERGWRDLPPFASLSVLQLAAHRLGEWKGVWRLWRSSLSNGR